MEPLADVVTAIGCDGEDIREARPDGPYQAPPGYGLGNQEFLARPWLTPGIHDIQVFNRYMMLGKC